MDLDQSMVVDHDDMAEVCPKMEHDNSEKFTTFHQNASSGNHKIDMWRNRNFDSGFQTMNHSEAPSMISSLHPSSHISGVSSVADYEHIPGLSDQQKHKFDGIYASTESQYGSAVRAIPELTNLMKDSDQAVVYKAVYIMQNIAKMDSDPMRRQEETVIKDIRVAFALRDVLREKLDHPNIIRVALGTLFNICNRQEGLDLISNAIAAQPDVISSLVRHISTVPFSCYKYSVLTLHSILSDKHRGMTALLLARKCDTLKQLCGWLDAEKSEKLLPVIVDLVRILCDKQNDQKTIFIKMNGAEKLLHIIRSCNYENLLWRSTQLLKTFSNFDAPTIVASGAREILCRMLTHQSQRLIISTLETLRNISDVPSKFKETNLLKTLLMLMGARHPTVMLYTVQILSNLIANNTPNKEYLVANNAVEMLLRSLYEVSSYMPRLSIEEAQKMEEYMESVICILRQLCVGHSQLEKVQMMIFKEPLIFLEKLRLMRPVLLKQTLTLLLKLCSNNALLFKFRDTRSDSIGFIEQIIYIWRVSCNHLHTGEEIDGIKVKDLIFSCVELLRILSRQPDILEQIVFFLRLPENSRIADCHTLLPLFVLRKSSLADNTKKSTLYLCYNLMLHEQMSNFLQNSEEFMNVIQQIQIMQTSPELAHVADSIIKTIMEKKERAMMTRYGSMADIRFSSPGISQHHHEMMETSNNMEVYDGAGEQWSQPTLTDDPFVEMYCSETSGEPSKPFNSPIYNSPNQTYTDNQAATHPGYYQEHQQPSTSYHRPSNQRQTHSTTTTTTATTSSNNYGVSNNYHLSYHNSPYSTINPRF